MTKELENDLRQIVRVVYCDNGGKKINQFVELIKSFCVSKESKEIVKVIKNEKKLIDKRFEKVYKYWEGYIANEEQLKETMKKIK